MPLVVHGLSKAFGAKRVLDSVDLVVDAGQIHALLGPNGSGKSTLIRCLSGAILPDAGTIEIDGVTHTEFTPREAIAAGTAVIYQNFSLVPTLTVADNIFLGDEMTKRRRIDHRVQNAEAGRFLEQFGRRIRPDMLVSQLSVGERQLVEIAKALHRQPSLLVLDEPTAALGETEARQLGEHLRRLRDEGLAILYVTHIIGEVFAIADRLTVLRDGHVVLSSGVSAVTSPQVISAISPASSHHLQPGVTRSVDATRDVVLRLSDVVVDGIGPVSLDVRRGEIMAIFGLLGSGRTELVEGVYGCRRLSGGLLHVRGREWRPSSPRSALSNGIALVAGDRIRQSIFDKLSSLDNMLLPHLQALGRRGVRRIRVERRVFNDTVSQVRLQPDDPNILAWALSGGNQQKLAVGRWLAALEHIDVLLLDEPTQGIDVGTRRDLYELLRRLAAEGKAILFTSSDPEETLSLADRVLVLRRGRLVVELSHDQCTEQRILALAHGEDDVRPGVLSPSIA